MTQIVEANKCVGCINCKNSCPTQAIDVQKDVLGFNFPVIHAEKCVDCETCRSVCPALTPGDFSVPEPKCFAMMAEDAVRKESSSGGVFPLLAKAVLEKAGIVFGAVMDETFCVRHTFITKPEELSQFSGSKYVQSDLGKSFDQAKAFLEEGKEVLFSGTPCQIAALYVYLRKSYETLTTVEVFCHGVLSHQFLQEYLSAFSKLSQPKTISFRDKSEGWRCDLLTLRDKNGECEVHRYPDSLLERAFHENIALRESCYDCKFAQLPRTADLSLGDFWQVEDYDERLNDGLGTSLVLVNSPRGEAMLTQIQGELKQSQSVPLSYPLKSNRFHAKIDRPLKRDRLQQLLKDKPMMEAAEYAIRDRYDIGLIGCWSVENHGSNLSYYALYSVVRDMGLEPILIDRPMASLWKPQPERTGFRNSPYRECDEFHVYPTKRAMTELNEKCDTFLLGSDQLLYHDLYASFDEFIDMSYIDNTKKKIAYATSLGRTQFEGTQLQRKTLSFWLKKYDAISVRERSGVPVLKNTFGVSAQQVLDPVFLCKQAHYEKLIKSGKKVSTDPYLACYILDPNREKGNAIRWLSEKSGLKYYVFSDVASQKNQLESAWEMQNDVVSSNEDWLRGIAESELFVTDSFHGMCFAIIFRKQFICIGNYRRGIERFKSLLSQLGLEPYCVASYQEIFEKKELLTPIDYDAVYEKLNQLKADSFRWLKQAISDKKQKEFTEYDMINKQLYQLELSEQKNSAMLDMLHERMIKLESVYPRIDRAELKVDALEHLYERIDRLETLHTCADGLEQKVDALEHLYARIDPLESLHTRADGLEQKVDALEHLYVRIDTLETLHTRADGLEQKVDALEHLYERIDRLEECLYKTK